MAVEDVKNQEKTELKILKELIEQNKLGQALEFSEKCSKDDEVIQSHRISLLIKFNRLKDALKLSDNCWMRFHNLVFLSQKISVLTKMNRLKEAYNLCELEEAKHYFSIQSQKILILKKQKKFKEALELCDTSEFKDKDTIQTQKIMLLMDLNRMNEAFELCNSLYEKDNEAFLLSKITVLKRMGRLEEALEICSQDCYEKNMYIQSERIKILVQMDRIGAAFKLCDKYAPKSGKIKKLRYKLIRLCQNTDYYFEDVKNSNTTELVSNLLTRIYCDDLSLEELESRQEELLEWQYFILKVAYYEKKNKKNGLLFIKENKDNFKDTDQQKKINLLLERLKNNKGLMLFDTAVYCDILKCSFDFQLQQAILESQKELSLKEEEKVIERKIVEPKNEEIIKQKEKVEVTPKRVVHNLELNDKSKYIIYSGVNLNQTLPKHKKNVVKEKEPEKEKVVSIGSVYQAEIEEIRKILYLEMRDVNRRKAAVLAWDRLECLADSSIDDIDKLERMENLLIRLGYLSKEKVLNKKIVLE
ncbi:MAG: hypothetical protein E7168_02545 [Firmicutes bacterium]|nr:hypothetical protein [Bacillota bacterium]